MKIAICDDDIKIAKYISDKILSQYPEYDIKIFENAEKLKAFLNDKNNCVNLLFMDIVLGDENGIEAAFEILKTHSDIMTVFVTAFANEYSEEIFSKIRPFGYLHKPIKDDILFGYIERANQNLQLKDEVLVIKEGTSVLEIPFSKIVFIESEKRKLHIHCVGFAHDVYAKLDETEVKLDERFIRCHKSFIVNVDYIKSLEKSVFVLQNGKIINISKSMQPDVRIKYFKAKGRIL